MSKVNWDEFAQLEGLRSVVDPNDETGFKNRLIDALHWAAVRTELDATKRILDFGCGKGRFTSRILDMGIDYVGVDYSAGMIEKAKELHPNATFYHFDGIGIPFCDNEFDTCLSCWVFQYIIGKEHCQDIVNEIVRVLKTGGKFIMLEQASFSGSKSGSVDRTSTEADYVSLLGKRFDVKSIRRIRSCKTPQLSYFSFRVAKRFPFLFPWFLNRLAKKEVEKYEKKNEGHYKAVDYYDFLLEAVVR